jgi:hypothetical protein
MKERKKNDIYEHRELNQVIFDIIGNEIPIPITQVQKDSDKRRPLHTPLSINKHYIQETSLHNT